MRQVMNQTLNNKGATLHYNVYGDKGPLMVFSHGYGNTMALWDSQREALSQHVRMLVWDMRGHGETTCPHDLEYFSVDTTVSDIVALIREQGDDSAILAGLSLGGYMSIATILRHPEMVDALCLVDTGPGFRSDEARGKWNRFAIRAGEKISEGKQAPGIKVDMAEHHDLNGLKLASQGMLAQSDSSVIDGLPSIAVNTLILIGEHDDGYKPAASYMDIKIPTSRLVNIDGAGHLANVDSPKQVNSEISRWLSDDVPRL